MENWPVRFSIGWTIHSMILSVQTFPRVAGGVKEVKGNWNNQPLVLKFQGRQEQFEPAIQVRPATYFSVRS